MLLERSMYAIQVSAADLALRLINGHPVGDSVGKSIDYYFRIFEEPLGTVGIEPSAPVVKSEGVVPVIERDHGGDVVLDKFVYKVGIELDALLVDLADTVGKDPCPADGEAICPDTDLLHESDIFFPAMIMIACDITVFLILYMVAVTGISVPDIKSFAVFIICAFDLISGRCGTPDKIF